MSELATELRRLSRLRRNSANFEKIQVQLRELDEHHEEADYAIQAADEAASVLRSLAVHLEEAGDENPLLPKVTVQQVEQFLALLPGSEETGDEGAYELLQEADQYAEEYDQVREDREYDAEAREEVWGALADSLNSIADYLDPQTEEN
jgi:hypothetical protein